MLVSLAIKGQPGTWFDIKPRLGSTAAMDSATQNSPGDSDSDSGQPESLSLSASASTAKGRNHALRILYSAQKRRIRETNKRRDEILKAQAGRRRRSMIASSESGERDLEHHGVEVDDIEGGSDMDTRLLRRMTRAMGEAEEETEQVSGSESGEEWGGIKSADPESFQSHPADEDIAISKGDTGAFDPDSVSEGDSVNHDDPSAVQSTASKYLPDHLFVAALAKSRPRNSVRPSRTTPEARSTTKKRRPPHARAKDVVVGCVPISPQFFCSMNKTSSQYTYSSHPVIISGKHASPCTWSDRGTPAYQEIPSECVGTSGVREEKLEALSSMGTTSLYVIFL